MHRYICGVPKVKSRIFSDIVDRACGDKKKLRMGRVHVLPFDSDKLVKILRGILNKERKLKVFYKSKAVSVKCIERRISQVTVKSSGGRFLIKPKVVIDATGEGEIIKLSRAGYSLPLASERQLAGFSFKVGGLKKSGILNIKVPYYLNKAVLKKKFPAYFKFTSFYPGIKKGEGFLKVNVPYSGSKNIRKFTMKTAEAIHCYLAKTFPEFKYSRIIKVSSSSVNREGVRLLGKYTLTKQDLFYARKFPDAVAKGNWPVEFWGLKSGQVLEYFKGNRYYGIPMRCLQSKKIDNFLATGRCISASPKALASTRVMGTCICLGEAAGKAASKICAYY